MYLFSWQAPPPLSPFTGNVRRTVGLELHSEGGEVAPQLLHGRAGTSSKTLSAMSVGVFEGAQSL